jgi:hypothetical protein
MVRSTSIAGWVIDQRPETGRHSVDGISAILHRFKGVSGRAKSIGCCVRQRNGDAIDKSGRLKDVTREDNIGTEREGERVGVGGVGRHVELSGRRERRG